MQAEADGLPYWRLLNTNEQRPNQLPGRIRNISATRPVLIWQLWKITGGVTMAVPKSKVSKARRDKRRSSIEA